MAVAEKLHELQQRRSKLHDEARELCERIEKEDRAMTKDEEARYVALLGSSKEDGGEIFELDKRIHRQHRLNALDQIGDDKRSGSDPFARGGQISDPLDVPLPNEDPRNTRNGLHKFRILRAAQGFLPGGQGLTGIEKEMSQELEQRTGIPSTWGGFKMPMYTRSLTFADIDDRRRLLDRVHSDRRDTRALDSGAGAGSIPTILEADWIELLRNAMRVSQAGMREIRDIRGKLAIPRQNSAATSYWVAESAAPTGSNQTLDQILFTPHTIGAFTDISRRFFELTILDSGEAFVKEDLTAILARGLDLAALNGPGNNFTPLGIFQNTGITSARTVALGTNGGVPTWPALVEMQTIINRGNAADLGPGTYIGNADVEGTLATTLKIGATFPIYLLDDEGRVYRKPLLTTQQIPANFSKGTTAGTLSALVYGVFNQLIAGFWSGIDILVDPYTGSNTGTIRIVSLMDCDIQVRHNEAFSVIVDMVTDQSQ
jgi:HK97 family phage major capsid protein